MAFRRRQRVTKNIAKLGKLRIIMLNGKHTGQLGVTEMRDEAGRAFSITGLERTLIDACVRPAYAGGPVAVLEAFCRAAPRLSPERLASTLRELEYVYPYEQAIGFYLERTGHFTSAVLDQFRQRPLTFDFYLDYAMKSKEYSPKWRVHFPPGLRSANS